MALNVPVSKPGLQSDVEDGTWPVTCVGVEQKHLDGDKFGNGEKCLLWMEFADFENEETGEPTRLDAMANFKLAPKSKLYEWLTALGCTIDLDNLEYFDAEEALGREGLAVVQHVERDGKMWPRITNIIAKPKGRANVGAGVNPGPSLVKPDGSINWIAFWKQVEANGVSRQNVADFFALDMEHLTKHLAAMGTEDVVQLIEELKV